VGDVGVGAYGSTVTVAAMPGIQGVANSLRCEKLGFQNMITWNLLHLQPFNFSTLQGELK
jgi:hypothetical protein